MCRVRLIDAKCRTIRSSQIGSSESVMIWHHDPRKEPVPFLSNLSNESCTKVATLGLPRSASPYPWSRYLSMRRCSSTRSSSPFKAFSSCRQRSSTWVGIESARCTVMNCGISMPSKCGRYPRLCHPAVRSFFRFESLVNGTFGQYRTQSAVASSDGSSEDQGYCKDSFALRARRARRPRSQY